MTPACLGWILLKTKFTISDHQSIGFAAFHDGEPAYFFLLFLSKYTMVLFKLDNNNFNL